MEKQLNVLTEDEVMALDFKESKALESHLSEIQTLIQDMGSALITKSVLEVVDGYDINDVSVERDYEYNDEGFTGNCMVQIDGVDNYYDDDKYVPRKNNKADKLTFKQLQEGIDDAVSRYKHIMPESMYFDIPQLRAKFFHNKLQEEIPVNSDSKIFTRFKL